MCTPEEGFSLRSRKQATFHYHLCLLLVWSITTEDDILFDGEAGPFLEGCQLVILLSLLPEK
jgi:hypothetical protein